jgi:hypothetical protein
VALGWYAFGSYGPAAGTLAAETCGALAGVILADTTGFVAPGAAGATGDAPAELAALGATLG